MKNATVHDIARIIERIAPIDQAEPWDNVGLQIGKGDWPVRKIWIALDGSKRVVENAVKNRIDMLVTHHPLFFKPIKTINLAMPAGYVIQSAIRHRLAIYSAHTNLDRARGGINDLLAEKLGLSNPIAMDRESGDEFCKLIFYLREDRVLPVVETLSDGGIHGSRIRSVSGYRQLKKRNNEKCALVEAEIQRSRLKGIISHVKTRHIGDILSCDAVPLLSLEQTSGLSRIGTLDPPRRLMPYAEFLKKALDIPFLRFAGDPDMMIHKVALCAGSGSGFIEIFLASDADIYVSGDLRYHDVLKVQNYGRGAIDISHFHSEHFYLEELAVHLRKGLTRMEMDVEVSLSAVESDPFSVL